MKVSPKKPAIPQELHLLLCNGGMILESMITKGNKQKRQSRTTLPKEVKEEWIYFLKNFFLPYPASPINPEPRRSMVAGSGTGVVPFPLVGPSFTKASLPPLAKPCTWIPILRLESPNSERTSANVCVLCKLNKIPKDSPGFTPFGCAGASESAENAAVVTKSGSALFAAGKFPGSAN